MSFYCYILYNDKNNKTYNGYTVDLKKRIRQHNGIIKGGARATTADIKTFGNNHWKYLAIVECDTWDKIKAMSLEWHIRYPMGRRGLRPAEYRGPLGRLKGLVASLAHPKFEGLAFRIKVCESYLEHAKKNGLHNAVQIEDL